MWQQGQVVYQIDHRDLTTVSNVQVFAADHHAQTSAILPISNTSHVDVERSLWAPTGVLTRSADAPVVVVYGDAARINDESLTQSGARIELVHDTHGRAFGSVSYTHLRAHETR